MHIFHDVAMRTLFKCTKPVGHLFLDSLLRELVTLQTLAAACCGVGVACRRVADAHNEPVAFGQGLCQSPVDNADAANVLQLHAVLVRYVFCAGLWGNAPYKTALAFPLVDAQLVAHADVAQPQHRLPLGSIQVFSTRLRTLWRPFKAEVAGSRLGNRVGEGVVGILPTLTCRLKHLH